MPEAPPLSTLPAREPRIWRIVLTGSESTGKTTLASQLAAHYETTSTPEFGRDFIDAKDGPFEMSDVDPIARGQIELEDEAVRNANRLVVQDTDLISTVVFTEHYHGSCPRWVLIESFRRVADLYLLMQIDVPWVPDSQRDLGSIRNVMHARFREAVRVRGGRWVEISGPWEDRFHKSVMAIDALMANAHPVQQ